jgi:hypothetical protein
MLTAAFDGSADGLRRVLLENDTCICAATDAFLMHIVMAGLGACISALSTPSKPCWALFKLSGKFGKQDKLLTVALLLVGAHQLKSFLFPRERAPK